MPFTPLHWGFPYVFGEFFLGKDPRKQRVQIISFLAATLSDFEGFFNLIGFSQVEIHGPLHSLLGCLLIGLGLLGFSFYMNSKYQIVSVTEDDFLPRYFKPDLTTTEIIFTMFSPMIFQLGLDVWLYSDIELFWPISNFQNPLASSVGREIITNISVFFMLIGILWFLVNFLKGTMRYMNLSGHDEY